MMVTRYLNIDEYEQWNNFVDESPEGSIYSKTWYLDSLQVKYSILAVLNNTEIYAGIVLAKNEINTYSNPLLCKYLGVIFKKLDGRYQKITSKKYEISNYLIKHLKEIKTFDYSFHPNYNNWLPFYWNDYKQRTFYTYRIENTDLKIFDNYSKILKNDIRYATKSNLIFSENCDLNTFYNTIEKTFKRQDVKIPFNKAKLDFFIDELSKRDAIKLFKVTDEERNIQSVCAVVYDKKSANFILNGSNFPNVIRGSSHFLLHNTILHMLNITQIFDFEGSIIPSIESFYRGYGGKLTPYYRIWKNDIFYLVKNNLIKLYKKL